MKEIAVLGSTGSIGTQTMDVIRLHSDLFHAAVIAAHKSIDKLREQAAEFHPHAIVITDEEGWLQALLARNLQSHTYNEKVAQQLIEDTKACFLPLFDMLREKLAQRGE